MLPAALTFVTGHPAGLKVQAAAPQKAFVRIVSSL
jgi:hypothetical protein